MGRGQLIKLLFVWSCVVRVRSGEDMTLSLMSRISDRPNKELMDMESKLHETLFQTGYNKLVKPQCTNHDKIIELEVGGALRQILNVNTRHGLIEVAVFVHVFWNDCRLTWNKEEYKNISNIVAWPDEIWVPDIVMYENIHQDQMYHRMRQRRPRIDSKGGISLVVDTVLETACKFRVDHFPMDRQNCTIVIGPWALDGQELKMRKDHHTEENELSVYITNGEWKLLAYKTRQLELKHPCCEESFTEVAFDLVIERMPLYYIFNLGGPTIVLFLLVCVSFLIPIGSGEKLSLNINIFLSTVVFLQMVAKMTPISSESFPAITKFFGILTMLVMLSCANTILVIKLYHMGEDGPPPKWLRVIFFTDGQTRGIRLAYYNKGVSEMAQKELLENCGLNSSTWTLTELVEQTKEEEEVETALWKEIAMILDRFVGQVMFLLLVLTTMLTWYDAAANILDKSHQNSHD